MKGSEPNFPQTHYSTPNEQNIKYFCILIKKEKKRWKGLGNFKIVETETITLHYEV